MSNDPPTNPDPFQQAWRLQARGAAFKLDINKLPEILQTDQQNNRFVLRMTDLTGIAVPILFSLWWIYQAWHVPYRIPWTMHLLIPVFLLQAGFTLFFRMRRPSSSPDRTLLQCAQRMLSELDSQEREDWAKLWWQWGSLLIAMLAITTQIGWEDSKSWWEFLGGVIAISTFFTTIILLIVYFHLFVSRVVISQKRRELQALIQSLQNDQTAEIQGQFPKLATTTKISPRIMFWGWFCWLSMAIAVFAILRLYFMPYFLNI